MGKIKCPNCLSCMNYVWHPTTGKRYLHCWLCQTYYEGRVGELVLTEKNPFEEFKTNDTRSD